MNATGNTCFLIEDCIVNNYIVRSYRVVIIVTNNTDKVHLIGKKVIKSFILSQSNIFLTS